jgi:hypothetical protein
MVGWIQSLRHRLWLLTLRIHFWSLITSRWEVFGVLEVVFLPEKTAFAVRKAVLPRNTQCKTKNKARYIIHIHDYVVPLSPLALPTIPLLNSRYQRPQRHAIIAPVRRSQQSVNVELRWLRVAEEDSRMMVELNDNHWALDAVVERIFIAETADPAPVRFGEVFLDLLQT